VISLFFVHPRKITKIENFLFFGIFSWQFSVGSSKSSVGSSQCNVNKLSILFPIDD